MSPNKMKAQVCKTVRTIACIMTDHFIKVHVTDNVKNHVHVLMYVSSLSRL